MHINITEVQFITRGLILLCSIMSFAIMFGVYELILQGIHRIKERRQEINKQEVELTILPARFHAKIENVLHEPDSKYFNYDRLDRFLKQNGAGYVHWYFINPVNFIFIKILISLFTFGFLMLSRRHLLADVTIAVAVFFIPDLWISFKNMSDNKKMLDDIQRANETVKLYGEASGALYNAIFECYKFSENARLKKGLFELYAELQMTHSYELAVEHFLGKFNNSYLTAFAGNTLQAGTIGFNELLLEDMSRDMAELQREQNHNYKNRLKTRWSLLLTGMFVVMLLICIYGMIGNFDSIF